MADISVTTSSSQDLYKVWQEKLNARQVKDAELVNKETELSSANYVITLKTETQKNAETKVANSSKNVSTLTANYNSISQQWKVASSQLNSVASKYTNSKDDPNLKAQYENAEANLRKIEEKLRETESKLQAAKTELENAQRELEKSNKELEDAITKKNNIENEISKIKEELLQLEQEIQEAESEYEVAKTKEAEAAKNNTRLTEEEALEEGYIIIKTADDLKQIEQNPSAKYILMNDIDLSGINWVPLCQGKAEDGSDIFSGILNGNGYSVKNLNINIDEGTKTENVGFFGITENAVISNINFENAQITTPETYNRGSVGVIAGISRGTTFEDISVSGNLTGHQKVGGLVGSISDYIYIDENGETALHNSSFKDINANVDINSSYYAGGLAGYINSTYSNDLVIENCNVSGNITALEKCAGGFIGEAGSTIITINNSQSNVDLTSPNVDDARVGGFIGCANGTKIAFCNSEYTGKINAEGDFAGEYYGYYMNDAHLTVFELSAGLPVDDILSIEGIDSLTPIIDKETGEAHYEAAVSTLNGMDKIVALIRNNPELADLITFNVLFDFETLDSTYAQTNYSQYGVVQHLYEETDSNGATAVVNDVYVDNEIDLESTFHNQNFYTPEKVEFIKDYHRTVINGLWKDNEGKYYVERGGEFIETTLEFYFTNQRTSISKRLDSDEVRFRERITSMVYYYQNQMYAALNKKYGFPEDYNPAKIDEPEYNYLKQRLENGETLTPEEHLALEVYELDYKVIDLISETTHNQGCGMGGDSSFLEETKAVPMKDEDGRIIYTTLSGIELRQQVDEEGNLLFDEDGEALYETIDGAEYIGLEEVYVKRGYPKTDENGNMLYTDAEGNSLTKSVDKEGNEIYSYEDGSLYEGDTEALTQQLEEYDLGAEYKTLEGQMKELLETTKGKETVEENEQSDNDVITLQTEEEELKMKEEEI